MHRSLPRIPRPVAIGAVALAALATPAPALAYIGPGAGFAFAGSLAVLVATFFLAVGTLLTWPITYAWRMIRVGNPYKKAQSRRIVVIGLDGMDPGLTVRLMQEGRLPNFEKLGRAGVFRPLGTSTPSMSPVAWSTYATGVDASGHRIYDFLTRDPCTYMPVLSSTEIGQVKRVLNIGRYVVPLGKPEMKLLQGGEHFWKHLGDRNIFSIIQRVPITFPPRPFKNGLLLAAMCIPDLRGTQGTFSFFSTETDGDAPRFTGGEQTVLRRNPRKPGVFRSRIVGPDNAMLKAGGRMTLPFTLTIDDDKQGALLEIDGADPVRLEVGAYSDWVTLEFKAMPGVTVSGIVRFYLMSADPEVHLYMTAIHIDPENPAMPISHPAVYAIYLAKRQGPFATLGLAEDTWALNEEVIDDKAFFEQAMIYAREREAMLFDALRKNRKGFVTTVFDTTDRVAHMFYRYLDPEHPALARRSPEERKRWADAVPRVYEEMDAMLGRVMDELGFRDGRAPDDTILMVISDHGFTSFKRGVNINAWLRDEGYLVLKDGAVEGGDYFENVDWSKTRAFSLGLVGIFINRKGREASGIVEEGEEYESLVREIADKLEQLVDPATGRRCVRKAIRSFEHFDGPYALDAPDVLVGYEGGYRHSWECAVGATTREVFSDNVKNWSGDHCVDPDVVPGVFFCNRRITTETPGIIDLPASILRLFGQEVPAELQGRMIFPEDGSEGAVGGLPDPASIVQSGAAPGALIHPDRPLVKEAQA